MKKYTKIDTSILDIDYSAIPDIYASEIKKCRDAADEIKKQLKKIDTIIVRRLSKIYDKYDGTEVPQIETFYTEFNNNCAILTYMLNYGHLKLERKMKEK